MSRIDLIWFGISQTAPKWKFGEIRCIQPSPAAVNCLIEEQLLGSLADAWLFWDSALGIPDAKTMEQKLAGPADVWHAGLLLGMGGLPDFIDFVSPVWMLNRDPDRMIEATSWRISLRCCLIRTDILRQMGGLLLGFLSLEAASLELGFRYIQNGVIVRHCPNMLTCPKVASRPNLSIADQLLFIRACFGKKWAIWSCIRAGLTKYANIIIILRSWIKIQHFTTPAPVKPYRHEFPLVTLSNKDQYQVSVLIPTINRYPYLRVLLDQLRNQTIKPCEVIVIDQTPGQLRDTHLQHEYSDMPIKWLWMDQAGQCSSRNYGLNNSKGNCILFIDDDDEVSENLIELHLLNLKQYRVRVSNGVTYDGSRQPLPKSFTLQRVSDVFPTNNSLLHKDVLLGSGLFDLAFDQGQRADYDLGMRMYLVGELMILNPSVILLHHHAPQGGLREHKARVYTYAASRSNLLVREVTSASEFYIAKRYFTSRQANELIWINVLGTFSIRGNVYKKILKGIISTFLLPNTLYKISQNTKKANLMLMNYPQIPKLIVD